MPLSSSRLGRSSKSQVPWQTMAQAPLHGSTKSKGSILCVKGGSELDGWGAGLDGWEGERDGLCGCGCEGPIESGWVGLRGWEGGWWADSSRRDAGVVPEGTPQ